MIKCDILYNNHSVMTVGFGNSKKQAERNASIQGCLWLEDYRRTNFEAVVDEEVIEEEDGEYPDE
jgi:hypothetical protein